MVEKKTYIIHNSGDKTKLRTGLNFIVLLSEKIELSVRYRFFSMEGYTLWYWPDTTDVIEVNEYQNHTILGGIKWKF